MEFFSEGGVIELNGWGFFSPFGVGIGTNDPEGYTLNVNGTSQFKENIRVNGHFGLGKAVDPAVPISINAGSNDVLDNVFEVYDSDDVLRTNLRALGCQFWYLKNIHGELGQVEICNPENRPGITFFDSEKMGRATIRLLDGGGMIFSASASGEWGSDTHHLFMDVDGRLSLGINDPEGYILNVNGTSQFKDTVVVNGNVGIGTSSPETKLAVNGTAKTKEIIVTEQAVDWPDYVLDAGYQMRDLAELEAFIQVNKHLPGIPTKEEIERDGQNLGAIQMKLLQKIEELTLYVIELKKEKKWIQDKIETLTREVQRLKEES